MSNKAAVNATNTEPLRIAIIAHALHAGGGISVGRNMIAALGRVAPEHTYFLSIPSGLGYEEVAASVPHHECSTFAGRNRLAKRLLYERGELRSRLKVFNPDLILALGNMGVDGFDCLQAVLFHNPYMWHSKEQYGPYPPIELAFICMKVLVQRHFVSRDLKRPNFVLLHQTQTAKKRIRDRFGYNGPAIHCPNAVSGFSIQNQNDLRIPEAMKPYASRFRMFYLTRYYPHKNIEAIVETYRKHRSELSDTVVFITIAPEQAPGARRILQSIHRHGLGDLIVNAGPLRQEELGNWFSNCSALLMPTLLESSSGTYLEAMHFGLPILTSDFDFAREICADAALYFDPQNTEGIRDAIVRLKRDDSAALELARKGHDRLAKLAISWDNVARHVMNELRLQSAKTTISKGL